MSIRVFATTCLLFVTVACCCSATAYAEDVTSGTCRFGDYEYKVGSTWHPRLESQGVIFCVTCRCFPGTAQSGRMNCTSQECPVRCSGEGDMCCKICKETGNKKSSSAPSSTKGMSPSSSPAEGLSCLHGGRQYREGQRFSSNLTILRPAGPEQCVQCQCQAGVVMCDVINCARPTCRQPVTTPDNCCPQCAVIAPTSMASTGPAVASASTFVQNPFPVVFTSDTGAKNKRGKSCLSGGKQYMEGESWHPVIGPLGPMLCVVCQCRSSRIECSRFRCPDASELPCAKPVRPAGQCCEACPSPMLKTDTASQSLCLPPGTDLLAYRARGPVLAPVPTTQQSSNETVAATELLQFAFSQQPPGDVELHAWRLTRGAILSFQTRHVAAQDFRHLVLQFRFTPLGATTSKHVVKFGRREKKLRHRCQVNCGAKLERLQQTLQLRPVAERASMCLPGETSL